MAAAPDKRRGLGRDFHVFFAGQTVSSTGTAFARFGLPLLVFQLTGSPLDLALTTAATFLPVVLFGLPIGAWTDRTDRKRLMVVVDLGRAALVASIPALSSVGWLTLEWVLVAAFVGSLLAMAFEMSQLGAVPHLVSREALPVANGLLQASYAAANTLGLAAAGAAVAVVAAPLLLLADAASFLVSAGSLLLIRTHFGGGSAGVATPGGLVGALRAGVRHLTAERWLLGLALLFALLNLTGSTPGAQLVVYAKQGLSATDNQVGLLYAAGSAGTVACSLVAGRIARRWTFRTLALAALGTRGVLTAAMGLTHSFGVALLLWAAVCGAVALFDVVAITQVQRTVPDHLLGRVTGAMRVIAWSPIPVGVIAGGLVIERTGHVLPAYVAIGGLILLLPFAFATLLLPAGPAPRD